MSSRRVRAELRPTPKTQPVPISYTRERLKRAWEWTVVITLGAFAVALGTAFVIGLGLVVNV